MKALILALAVVSSASAQSMSTQNFLMTLDDNQSMRDRENQRYENTQRFISQQRQKNQQAEEIRRPQPQIFVLPAQQAGTGFTIYAAPQVDEKIKICEMVNEGLIREHGEKIIPLLKPCK